MSSSRPAPVAALAADSTAAMAAQQLRQQGAGSLLASSPVPGARSGLPQEGDVRRPPHQLGGRPARCQPQHVRHVRHVCRQRRRSSPEHYGFLLSLGNDHSSCQVAS